MMQYSVTGEAAAPMPERISAWGIYDVFTVQDNAQIFLAAVSDAHWQAMCQAFGWVDLQADPQYASNNDRVRARPTLLPVLRERLAPLSAAHIGQIFEAQGLPYAPISQPQDLLQDPHLLATGGLADIRLPDGARAGQTAPTTLLPLRMDGERLPVRTDPPRLGEHTTELLRSLGYDAAQISAMQAAIAVR